eukprot:CAMPEP_0173110578 /NCGR_PEP_ID=MMETSP1102-20130122/44452_1 /TAXON_ID=49646 /ORGANISM="Geminigera sp., Strain Caron Lab Isolate" /LENGTH=209 /DNA_ID=CAMNT_0014010377 /DNA_START=42 /DNA_END=667 /DNA_ORIENTATION=-
MKLQNFDQTKPVWVEDEASVIGKIHVPKMLFESIMPATRYEVRLPLDQRVKHLMTEYKHMVDNPDTLKALLNRLTAHQGHARIEEWHARIDSQDITGLVKELLAQHYDPANARSIKSRLSKYQPGYQTIKISSLDTDTLLRELPAEMYLPASEQTQTVSAAEKVLWFHETADTGFNSEDKAQTSRHERRNKQDTDSRKSAPTSAPMEGG